MDAELAFSSFSDFHPATSRSGASRQNRSSAAGLAGNFELRAVKEVHELFRGTFDDEVIESVLESCKYDAERATTLLCERIPDNPPSNGEQDTARQHAGNTRSERNREYYSGPCLWDALPTECQLQVAVTPFRHSECQSSAPIFQHESSMSLYKAIWHAGLGESISERHGEGGWDMQGFRSACQGDALRAAHAETAGRCALPSWQLPARRLSFTGTPMGISSTCASAPQLHEHSAWRSA